MELKVATKDLIGDLKDFPIEVVEIMLQKQYKQVDKMDISIFQKCKFSDNYQGGFHWSDTIEGHEFWNDVIREGRFDVFFERYPKLSKNVYIRGDVHNGEEVIKELESRGGINYHGYSGNVNGLLYFIDPVTNYIVHASKLDATLQNLLTSNYTEITPGEYTMVELTMEEIAEKFGVGVDKLRIKK